MTDVTDRSLRALVYGDVNLNLIDGSAVWLASTVECLARAGVAVTVLLKARIETDRLLRPLRALPTVALVEPTGSALTPHAAASATAALHRERPFDLVVVRGASAAAAMVAEGSLEGALWTYLTDVPQSVTELDSAALDRLTAIVRGSRRLLCQTPELRGFIEAVVPAAAGRTVLWEPIIATVTDLPMRDGRDEETTWAEEPGELRIGYAGKFAPDWNTDRMLELPAQLAARGVPVHLEMIGDKIHRQDAGFADRMDRGLANSAVVRSHGGLDRETTMNIMASWDIGLSWRSPALDASLELSTKVLEYGSVGTAPVLNRTPMHERLLGSDYPLFVTSDASVIDVLERAHSDRGLLREAAARARLASEHYTMAAAVDRTRTLLARAFSHSSALHRPRAIRLVIAGHDLKFMHGIADLLATNPAIDVRIDAWEALAVHDEQRSQELLAWADVIVCEWAGPNTVWYSARLRRDQRLIVRLHRFELQSPWIRDVRPGTIERIVCVNEHYRQRVVAETTFSDDAVIVIPNAVDRAYFDRPKAPGSERVLGMLGIVPLRKRPDRALRILRQVNSTLPGFQLSLKSAMPWDLTWIWRQPEERAFYVRLLDEIARDPQLQGSVVVEPHGGDVAAWLQRTGWVLSLSDDESFHLAPAEGMAAGCVPLIMDWPGAADVYDDEFIHRSENEIVERIVSVTADVGFDRSSAQARAAFPEEYDLPNVASQWAALILGADTNSGGP